MKQTRLTTYNKPRVIEAIRRSPETHFCTISKPKKTNPQIRTVHGWIRELQVFFAESQGKAYTFDQIKLYLKGLFGEVITVTVNGKETSEYKSFADYEKDEMSKFMEQVDHHCVEFGCYLTQPGFPDEN